jgi:hypothetical protein
METLSQTISFWATGTCNTCMELLP